MAVEKKAFNRGLYYFLIMCFAVVVLELFFVAVLFLFLSFSLFLYLSFSICGVVLGYAFLILIFQERSKREVSK